LTKIFKNIFIIFISISTLLSILIKLSKSIK
jgi:hypothetical protein